MDDFDKGRVQALRDFADMLDDTSGERASTPRKWWQSKDTRRLASGTALRIKADEIERHAATE